MRAELARKSKTQQNLADYLHLSQPAVSRRLSGAASFTIDELVSIASWLELDVRVFIPQGVAA